MKTDIAKELADLSPHEFYGFASYMKGRTNGNGWSNGDYKRHKTLGQAKSSISYGGGFERLYEWSVETSAWVEIPIREVR